MYYNACAIKTVTTSTMKIGLKCNLFIFLQRQKLTKNSNLLLDGKEILSAQNLIVKKKKSFMERSEKNSCFYMESCHPFSYPHQVETQQN